MSKPQVLEDADKVLRTIFVGMAIPHQPTLADGVYGPIRSEKILKFNRKALRKMSKSKVEKIDPRMLGGEDTMIIKAGTPGSRERVEALRSQYEAIETSGEQLSPFWWDDEDMVKAIQDNNITMEEYNSLPLYGG